MGERARRWVVPVVAVVVVAIVGAAAVILVVDTDADGASVALESATDPGTDPFTRSVAVGEPADSPTTIAPITRTVTAELATDTATGGLTTTGNTPGLYGGTGNESVCDPRRLADLLTRTPAKAAAWAATLGITTRRVPTSIAGLTPVVLTTDTRVTNHGYTDGAATPRQAVLQAGTAVLVDDHGLPRVKCGCGNPLTEPTAQPIATTTGTPWAGYRPDTVTTVTPAPRPQPTLTLTDITTGDTYTQPTGAVLLAATEAGVLYAFSDDGTTSTTVGTIAPVTGPVADIAASAGGSLYATTANRLYRVDPQTAAATPVGTGYRTVNGMNALTFIDDGRLIGATQTGTVAVIDPNTGIATEVGRYGTGLGSSGDLTVGPDGELLATATTERATTGDALVRVDPDTGTAQVIGDGIGFRRVDGLFVSDGRLMGLVATVARCSGAGALIEVSASDGRGEFRRCLDFSPGGSTRLARPPAAAGSSGAVRSVDLLNRAYDLDDGCAPAESVTLVDGRSSRPDPGGAFDDTVVATVKYFDVTGDGRDDGVLKLNHSTGGGAECYTYFVLTTAESSEPALVRIPETFDRSTLSVDAGGKGRVAIYTPNDDTAPRCCPNQYLKTLYQYGAGAFTKVGVSDVPKRAVVAEGSKPETSL